MKIFTLIFLLIATGCATKFDKRISQEEELVEHLSQEDKMVGDELPAWTDGEGINGGFVYAVGEAEDSATQNVQILKDVAKHAAKMKIAERLPAEYKYIAQRALSNVSGGQYDKLEIAKGDLYGLQGVKTSRRFTTCRKIVRYTDFGMKVNRICFVQASVSLKNLNDAITRTVKMKYGEDTGNKFNDILRKQVEQELLNQPNRQIAEKQNVSRSKSDGSTKGFNNR